MHAAHARTAKYVSRVHACSPARDTATSPSVTAAHSATACKP